jgi:integrase
VSTLGRALGPGKLRLEQRGSGRPLWTLDFKDAHGRRRRQALSPDKRVAERMRADLIAQRDLELAGLGTVEGQSRSLAEVRDLYLTHLRATVGASQATNVAARLGKVLAALRVPRVRDLRVIDLLRYRAELVEAGKSNRTANAHVGAVKAMLNWVVSAQLVAENPVESLKPLPMGEAHQVHVRRALSDEEIARFLAAAEQDDADVAAYLAAEKTIASGTKPRAYAQRRRTPRVPQALLWRALVETGARWGELTQATWADLDAEDRTLRLRAATTKTRRERVIPLRSELVAELLALRPVHQRVRQRLVQPGDRIFLAPEGRAWDAATTGARRIFRRILERAGIARRDSAGRFVDIHALRHTAATVMIRRGVPLAVAQRVLGHVSPEMTARVYTHLEVEDLRVAVAEAAPAAGGRAERLVRVS